MNGTSAGRADREREQPHHGSRSAASDGPSGRLAPVRSPCRATHSSTPIRGPSGAGSAGGLGCSYLLDVRLPSRPLGRTSRSAIRIEKTKRSWNVDET